MAPTGLSPVLAVEVTATWASADSRAPPGTLDNVEYDAATGKLTFDSYDRQFRFSGILREKELTGKLTRAYPRGNGGERLQTEDVKLAASVPTAALMRDFPTIKEWNAEAAKVLTRSGPPSAKK
jgi:hypothetical protein